MLEQPGSSDDVCQLVELLDSQIARLEQFTNETGASPIDPSTSETVETTLLHAVAALRRIRNGEKPVNKLPPEILSRIFSLVPGRPHRYDKADGLKRDFGPHAIAPLADLLPLLSVCGRWRSVTTSSSFLWSTIDNRNSRALSISSRYRSGSGLLDAHVSDTVPSDLGHLPHLNRRDWSYAINSAFLDLLRGEGHRIREFHAEVRAILLPDLTAFPGENLQTCRLRLMESSEDNLGAIRPLFNGHTPKLKSLIMDNFLFIPSNHFPSLTHLILDGAMLIAPEGPYTFYNFLLFLSRCPNLEVLHLFALDVARFQELPNGVVVAPLQLHHLRKFSNDEALCDRTRRNHLPYIGPHFRRAILAHLQFSPDCLIRLATILPHELGRTLNSLPFDKPFTSVYLGGYNRLSEFYTSKPNGIESECFSIMATDRHRQRGVRIDFQMPETRYAPRDVTMQSARACLRDGIRSAPLLARVRELWVVPMATLLLGEPCSLLGCLPHLTTLVIGLCALGLNTAEDVRCHWEPLRALEVRDDCVIPCPRLRTLCVYVTTEEHVVQLYDVLLSRGEAGYPVRRLVVGFYRPPPSTVLELAEGLWGLVEDFTLLEHSERCPDDLLWVHRLPSVCRDSSERNTYWPAWM